MQRKWQKMATAAAAGMLIASQVMMQASAAGGTINVDVTTKTPVLRVVVPTTIAVSVDEFEMVDEGSQIYSSEFTMKNVSESPVKVNVTSTATLGTGVTLVSTKEAAKNSKAAEMWLAAVAAVGGDATNGFEYALEDIDGAGTGIGAATASNATAFTTKDNASKAVQDFYLANATSAQYKAMVGGDIDTVINDSSPEGADFYKLTAVADQTALNAALAVGDIYTVGTKPTSGSSQAITVVTKGSTATYAADTQYTIADTPTAYTAAKADAGGIYLWIDAATPASGDEAAFRYAGVLSSAKDGWTKTDLSKIVIAYDIAAISTSAYGEMADELKYGYKVATGDDTLTLVDGVLTAKIKAADFANGTLQIGETVGNLDSKAGTWGGGDDAVTFTFNSTWANAIKGQTCVVTVNLKDGTKYTASFDVAN